MHLCTAQYLLNVEHCLITEWQLMHLFLYISILALSMVSNINKIVAAAVRLAYEFV